MANPTGVMLSTNVKQRHMKMMFWGGTGTRKTETVLRNFPKVFLIDAEGNSDQCLGMKEIPPFLVARTKDPREVVKYLDMIIKGEIKFPDGSVPLTLAIDSHTVLWGLCVEVATQNAEKRAVRYNKAADDGTLTPMDWGIGKRPMKSIANRINMLPVKFLIEIARDKEPYSTDDNKNAPKGPNVADIVKGTDFDMNLSLHFTDVGSKWQYEVTKVQGKLGEKFPKYSKGATLDIPYILAYADMLTGSAAEGEDEEKIAGEILAKPIADVKPVAKPAAKPAQPAETKAAAPAVAGTTWADMTKYAGEHGIKAVDIGPILKSNGFTSFTPSQYEPIKAALDAFINERDGSLTKEAVDGLGAIEVELPVLTEVPA